MFIYLTLKLDEEESPTNDLAQFNNKLKIEKRIVQFKLDVQTEDWKRERVLLSKTRRTEQTNTVASLTETDNENDNDTLAITFVNDLN